MSIALIFEAIMAALKFPDAVVKLVNVLKKTPQEKHEAILAGIQKESENFESDGRPKWG